MIKQQIGLRKVQNAGNKDALAQKPLHDFSPTDIKSKDCWPLLMLHI